MNALLAKIEAFVKDEEGLTTVEYAVAGGLIAAGVVVVFGLLGEEVDRVLRIVTSELETIDTAP